MRTIKSFEEIKNILRKFKRANGVGYVITPQLLLIGEKIGLFGYSEALAKWREGSVFTEKVCEKDERIGIPSGLFISWNGPSLIRNGERIFLGIEKAIEEIEEALKGFS